jgi:periplasmic divalent cation tolerance protein
MGDIIMNEFVLVLVTASERREAEEIAMKLISSGLSPCINIIESCTSIYQWKGEVRKDNEVLMLIKSKRDLFDEVQSLVEKAHSYDVPEVIGIGLECISEKYAGFLRGFVGGA